MKAAHKYLEELADRGYRVTIQAEKGTNSVTQKYVAHGTIGLASLYVGTGKNVYDAIHDLWSKCKRNKDVEASTTSSQ